MPLKGKTMLKTIAKFQTNLFHVRTSERGATAVEYGLLVALIAAVIVAVVVVLGSKISGAFEHRQHRGLTIPVMRSHRAVALRERGATAVEYGLLVALIAAVIAVAVTTLGNRLPGWFTVNF